MNYIKELNAFYDWLETNSLSTSAIALWHALMHVNNKAGWVEEFGVATSVLCAKTGLSDRTVRNARNELKQRGRIEWRSRKGNQSAVYKMISFVESVPAIVSDNGAKNSKEKDLPEIGAGNTSGNVTGNTSGNLSGNASTLYKLNETKLKETEEEEERKKSSAASALYDKDFKLIIKAYNENIRPITPVEAERLEKWLEDGMEGDVIISAIEESVVYNKRSMGYIEAILKNWYAANIKTKADLDAYMRDRAERKTAEGKKQGLNKQTDFNKFDQHEYSEDDLESLFVDLGAG